MFVHEAAVIGGDGGGSYSHAADLEAAGFCLGAGPNCMRLSKLHVEEWQVLSHHSATYTTLQQPTQTFTPTGHGGIRAGEDKCTDFVIPADHRVNRVCAGAGDRSWCAGGRCMNFLEIETAPVAHEGEDPSAANTTSIGWGGVNWGGVNKQKPGTTLQGQLASSQVKFKVLIIPKSLTLVGIAGRAGDSWDQLSLLVGPWLPVGGWSPNTHKHLVAPFKQQARTLLLCLHQLYCSAAMQPLNKQVNECLVAALFDATFMTAPAAAHSNAQQAAVEGAPTAESAAAAGNTSRQQEETGGSPVGAFVVDWVQQQVQQARAECEELLIPQESDDRMPEGVFYGYDDTDDSSDQAEW